MMYSTASVADGSHSAEVVVVGTLTWVHVSTDGGCVVEAMSVDAFVCWTGDVLSSDWLSVVVTSVARVDVSGATEKVADSIMDHSRMCK